MKLAALSKRRTKIVCTIGPATGSAAIIERLIRGGMNIARLNLSHGTLETHARYVEAVRRISARLGIGVAILMDIPGPKYRTGKLKKGRVTLKEGAEVTLTVRDVQGDEMLVPVNLPTLLQDVRVNNVILLDDGAIQLRALGKTSTDVRCRVTVGGELTEGRGLVVPGMRSSAPFVTESLREHILFCLQLKPDYLAISYVRSADDVSAVRGELHRNNADIPIIAKIERGQAVRDFDGILARSDGIMVARGDLGADIPLERVPLVQKELIRKSNRSGKPVITATQMLESMVRAAQPTRAEVADVANAIFDGSDAIMLSAETSVGKYPVAALRMMSRIALETEKKLPYRRMLAERSEWIELQTDELISYNACYTAEALAAKAIVAFTHSGSTARRVSKYRPGVPIVAVTPFTAVCRRLLLHWGVIPVHLWEEPSSIEVLFRTAATLTKELGMVEPGDLIAITGGIPVGITGATNLLKVEKIS